MLKKSITYKTAFGNAEIVEDFYFNLTKADLAELELGEDGGMSGHFERIAAAQDNKVLVKEFKTMILRAYGVRSGSQFIKTPEATAAFASSEAYSELFIELISDTDKAIEFFKGIMPGDLTAEVEKLMEKQNLSAEPDEPLFRKGMDAVEEATKSPMPPPQRVVTARELRDASTKDFEEIQTQLSNGQAILSD